MRTTNLLGLLPFVAAVSAAVNGHCSGPYATGNWGAYGICVSTSSCSQYGGQYTNGACPDDGGDIKCCLVGFAPNQYNNPCGGASSCRWLENGNCPGALTLVRNHCPGGDNYACCRA